MNEDKKIIVSNRSLDHVDMTYDSFITKITNGESFEAEADSIYLIDAVDMEKDVYDQLVEYKIFKPFCLDRAEAPEYQNCEELVVLEQKKDVEITAPGVKESFSPGERAEGFSTETPRASETQRSVESSKREELVTAFENVEKPREDEPINIDYDSLINSMVGTVSFAGEEVDAIADDEPTDARVYTFGASKGGTGKTTTSIMSTYRYAKTHPNKSIAFVDFDLLDGQIGPTIDIQQPTMRRAYSYYNEAVKNGKQFTIDMVKKAKVNHPNFSSNIDFYLAPPLGHMINNNEFWSEFIKLIVANYDVVVFDTAIDYLNIKPVSFAYKVADKILLITSPAKKSCISVSKQINALSGVMENPIYSKEAGLKDKIFVVVTQMPPSEKIKAIVNGMISRFAPIVAMFGEISTEIYECEYSTNWNKFDNDTVINNLLDKIMA